MRRAQRLGIVLTALALLGAGAAFVLSRGRSPHALPSVDESAIAEESVPGALTWTSPVLMMALESRGLDLGRVLSRGSAESRARSTRELRAIGAFADVARVITEDVRELSARPGIADSPTAPNHPFRASWLDDPRARFDLVGVVARADRVRAEPEWAGEVRLVYRLTLVPQGRPPTRLPMTLNAILAWPRERRSEIARFLSLPASAARAAAIAELVLPLGAPRRLEIDVQSLHGPAMRLTEDDHAEYVLRSFDVAADARAATPRPLLNTPDPRMGDEEGSDLLAWVRAHFAEIDEGRYVMPAKHAATRAVSVTPRGLARPMNRPFSKLFGHTLSSFADLPFQTAKVVRSPAALLRRLDTGTCQGCHQSRGVAGFHLLGEDRPGMPLENALEVGRSQHAIEIAGFRATQLAAFARGDDAWPSPLPFAERASEIGYGAHCGLGDPGFAAWTCPAGLTCRDWLGTGDVGLCLPTGGNGAGDACQNAKVVPKPGAADGDDIATAAAERCTFEGRDAPPDYCAPNGYGFPGGVCSEPCARLGEVRGESICADVPAAGYESTCFETKQPIEKCIAPFLVRRRLRSCSASRPCRDDYGCARVRGAPPGLGVCVPPYFVFQARVDGPLLDR